MNAQTALIMVCKMLHNRLVDADYDAWLGRITEIISTDREARAPSLSLRPLRP